MSNSILISTDSSVLQRWSAAFPDSRRVLAAEDARATTDRETVIWLHLPRDGEEAARLVSSVSRLLAPARLVALSDTPSDEQALDLMERGAVGYCHAHAGAAMLQQVATVVRNQGLWVGPDLLQRMIRASLSSPSQGNAVGAAPLSALSVREREVASAVGRGASNKEIARELAITERTVKAHLSTIFMKLAVRDRLHLALLMRSR